VHSSCRQHTTCCVARMHNSCRQHATCCAACPAMHIAWVHAPTCCRARSSGAHATLSPCCRTPSRASCSHCNLPKLPGGHQATLLCYVVERGASRYCQHERGVRLLSAHSSDHGCWGGSIPQNVGCCHTTQGNCTVLQGAAPQNPHAHTHTYTRAHTHTHTRTRTHAHTHLHPCATTAARPQAGAPG